MSSAAKLQAVSATAQDDAFIRRGRRSRRPQGGDGQRGEADDPRWPSMRGKVAPRTEQASITGPPHCQRFLGGTAFTAEHTVFFFNHFLFEGRSCLDRLSATSTDGCPRDSGRRPPQRRPTAPAGSRCDREVPNVGRALSPSSGLVFTGLAPAQPGRSSPPVLLNSSGLGVGVGFAPPSRAGHPRDRAAITRTGRWRERPLNEAARHTPWRSSSTTPPQAYALDRHFSVRRRPLAAGQ